MENNKNGQLKNSKNSSNNIAKDNVDTNKNRKDSNENRIQKKETNFQVSQKNTSDLQVHEDNAMHVSSVNQVLDSPDKLQESNQYPNQDEQMNQKFLQFNLEQLSSQKIQETQNYGSASNYQNFTEQKQSEVNVEETKSEEHDIYQEEDEDMEDNSAQYSNLNIMEKFRQAMKNTHIQGDSQIKSVVPPAEDLIRKTVFEDEPIKNGGAIAFLKMNRLLGQERIEKMNLEKRQGDGQNQLAGQDMAPSASMSDYMINANEAQKLVYCRFGEKYIQDIQRRKNSNLSAINQPSSNLSTATYLINIKKLIEEHNIDGEKRDFKCMRTGQMQKSMQLQPYQFYKLKGNDDKTLIFESRFESGNLLAVIKVTDLEYDLILQNDINTNGHTQWFFFRVSNTTKGDKVKFNILNLAKTDSLYNYGMKVLCFSNKIKDSEGIGWHRVGENINYYANQYKRDNNKFVRSFYTLTFTHQFQHDNDQQFFAHCFPYTYSDLQEDLCRIEKDSACLNFYNRSTLTRTIAGNRCDYLTVTSKDKDPKSAKAMAKKGVFFSARVHPGESNSSWIMKGLIDYLVSQTPEAKALRENFVFKIVPILNPDGVINGNYRCCLSGQDLNRRWKAPNRVIHPVNFAVKKLIRQFSKERELVLYCDLHGHSRRKNMFMYGNNIKDQPHASRVFPYIMSKLCDYFSFEQSRFSMNRLKEGTARIAMFKELNIANIFTLEASFCGADKGNYKDQHFSTDYLMMAGRRLLESLIVYCKIEVTVNINEIKNIKKIKSDLEQPIEEENPQYKELNAIDIEKELTNNKKLIIMTMGEEGGSSGSDSEPSADNLDEEEMAKIVPIQQTKKPKKEEIKVKKGVLQMQQKKPQSPLENIKRQPPVLKQISRSPTKRPTGYSLFDRLQLKKRKPEMKDAWTQTTPKSKEQLEKERREHKQRKQAQLLLMQQQQQLLLMQNYQQQLNTQQPNRGMTAEQQQKQLQQIAVQAAQGSKSVAAALLSSQNPLISNHLSSSTVNNDARLLNQKILLEQFQQVGAKGGVFANLAQQKNTNQMLINNQAALSQMENLVKN